MIALPENATEPALASARPGHSGTAAGRACRDERGERGGRGFDGIDRHWPRAALLAGTAVRACYPRATRSV
jgi:hypothetical protein